MPGRLLMLLGLLAAGAAGKLVADSISASPREPLPVVTVTATATTVVTVPAVPLPTPQNRFDERLRELNERVEDVQRTLCEHAGGLWWDGITPNDAGGCTFLRER